MKTLIIIFLMAGSLYSAEFRDRDGKPEYAKYTVDGRMAWDEAEKDYLVERLTIVGGSRAAHTPIVVTVTLTDNEKAVVENIEKFKNNTEIQECLKGNKEVLGEKIADIQEQKDKYKNTPTHPKYVDADSRLTKLLNYYNGLP